MVDTYSITHKPTSTKNPQTNIILERVHQVVMNMVFTANLDVQDTCKPETTGKIMQNVAE